MANNLELEVDNEYILEVTALEKTVSSIEQFSPQIKWEIVGSDSITETIGVGNTLKYKISPFYLEEETTICAYINKKDKYTTQSIKAKIKKKDTKKDKTYKLHRVKGHGKANAGMDFNLYSTVKLFSVTNVKIKNACLNIKKNILNNPLNKLLFGQ